MAARLLLASLCCIAIFLQESSGSCIRRSEMPKKFQLCMHGERSASQSSLDCSSISRNSMHDSYESSSEEDASQCEQTACSRARNRVPVATSPRRKCPMYNYVVEDNPPSDPEPCKAYGVMVAVPKPTSKATFTSTSHKYQVEKTKAEMMEKRKAYGVAVAVPKKMPVARAPQVAYDYRVETPKREKPECKYAYGVAVVKVPESEPCLPCMEDDNTPDEGFYEHTGPCCTCVDDGPDSHAEEPRSGGCTNCARGTQAGGYYYESKKSSSRSSSCNTFEERYEGRRDASEIGRVSYAPIQSVRESLGCGGSHHFEEDDNSDEDSEVDGLRHSECSWNEKKQLMEYSKDDQSSSEEDLPRNGHGSPSYGMRRVHSRNFQDHSEDEEYEVAPCESCMVHSRFGNDGRC